MSEGKRESSAIDVIYELKNMMEKIDKRLEILDNNLKLMNNKVVKLQKTVGNLTLSSSENSDLKKEKTANPIIKSGKRSDKYVTGPIRTYGKILSKDHTPIKDVQVAIFNDENEVIKTRKTDSKGFWEVRLPQGEYSVQYTHKRFKPINISITLNDDMKEKGYEVK